MDQLQPLSWKFERETLDQALKISANTGRSVMEELEQLTGMEPRVLLRTMATLFNMPIIEMSEMLQLQPAFDCLPLSKAMQRQCVLFRDMEHRLLAVFSDPFDGDSLTWIEAIANVSSQRLALCSDIQAYLTKQEESIRAVDHLIQANVEEKKDVRASPILSFLSVSESASPAVKLVNSTLYDALRAKASDVHLESTNTGLAIKYRIDGVLDHAASIAGIEAAEQVISRLKVLAELDIAERRIPQDGSFRVEASGREIDLRVSIMPSIHGEDAVIRILDKRAMIESYGALTLEALGFDSPSLKTLRLLAEQPYGMLLVTGPTGSGKTTTLYAALTEIHNGRDKIITIEDPVEYQLSGVLQIPVNEKKGLTFAKGLRSILRHDPDKIMVGEIRDTETAEMAVQSALTGHLVLTTVHANNVYDVFGRFKHMGIDPYAFVSSLNGIWAQRLIRLNCPHCTKFYVPESEELALLDLAEGELEEYRFCRGEGCGDCRGTGYKGRKAIAEILILNDLIRELIVEQAPIRQIKEEARRSGTRSLREAALDLVKNGETTIAEIKRVTLNG
jgi:general secretion pathway protein E